MNRSENTWRQQTMHTWRQQTMPFNNEINAALQQQHHAAQFLALVGRHLIPKKDDDSNTNMEFIPGENLLLGNALSNGMRVGLHLTDLKLFPHTGARIFRVTLIAREKFVR